MRMKEEGDGGVMGGCKGPDMKIIGNGERRSRDEHGNRA